MKKALENPNKEAPLVFCKTVSQVLVGRYEYFPDKSANYRYTILLRDPIKVFVSWRKAIYALVQQISSCAVENVKSWEEFHFIRDAPEKAIFKGRLFKELYDIYQHVKKNLDPNVVIIDSDDVLNDPEGMLRKYCATIGLPFSMKMLSWNGDPKVSDDWWFAFKPMYDFEWVRIFAQNALYCKGFKKPTKAPSLDEVTDDIKESFAFVKPYYEEMYDARLKP